LAEISITVGTTTLEGWQSVSLTSSLDELAQSFDLQVGSRQDGKSDVRGTLREGEPCQVRIDGTPVITGYIDQVSREESATAFSLGVSGRSRAADLVDCSVIGKNAWRQAAPLSIARDLCAPYGITPETEIVGLAPLSHFRAQAGEEVFAALDRLGRQIGGRWISTPNGHIELIRVGQMARPAGEAIASAKNIYTAAITLNATQRFSRYVFRGQVATSDELSGEAAASVEFAVSDDGVSRYRPLVIQDDAQGGKTALEARARWERATRAGKAVTLRYEVRSAASPSESWYAGPSVWEPGTIAQVQDELLRISGPWLISRVELVRNDQGTAARLELVGLEAYDPEPVPKKRPKGTW
jgi:prophage tail gpP-like protein